MRANLLALAIGSLLFATTALAATDVAAQEDDCGFACLGILTPDDVPSAEDMMGPLVDVLEPPGSDELHDMTTDVDGDGLTDDVERAIGTDPYVWDTDGDSWNDGWEVNDYGTSPLSPDSDGDGLLDEEEAWFLGTNPLDPDTDDDGVDDRTEYRNGTIDPNTDTDGDGVIDSTEYRNRTDPRDPCNGCGIVVRP